MPINVEPLRKILQLESEKGYLDSAVIGGLDRFLHRWTAQATQSLTSPQLLRQFQRLGLTSSNYASLTREQRKEWVSKVFAFLPELERVEVRGEAKPARKRQLRRPPLNADPRR